jgi:acetyl esterase/lipase
MSVILFIVSDAAGATGLELVAMRSILFCLAASLLSGAEPTHKDVVYRSLEGMDLKLDLYVSRPNARLVVWVHGGGWQAGNKANPPGQAYLLEKGFTVASVQYRLSHQAKWPAQLEDCEAAILWLRENAKRYGYNASKVGAYGSSAGGHLVAMLGTRSQGKARADVVVDLFGPTDFLKMNDRPGGIDHLAADSPESKLLGAPIETVPEKVKDASPLRWVTQDAAPMLIIHGDRDPLVLIEQSYLLRDALARVKVPHELEIVEGGGHGGKGFYTPEQLERVAAWFARLR